jgi:hypothetical protein
VNLRYSGRLRHIGVGLADAGRRVLLLVADHDVRVLTEDGELLSHATIDPSTSYQPGRLKAQPSS